jgi:MFS family permease
VGSLTASGERLPTLGSLLFFITIAILGGISPAIGNAAAWATAFFLGVGFGSRPTLFNLIAADIFQGKHAGRIMGLGATGFGIGGSFGSLSAGYIYDYTGSYDWAIRICMMTLVISAISAWIAGPSRIRKTVRSERNHAGGQHLLTGFYQ